MCLTHILVYYKSFWTKDENNELMGIIPTAQEIITILLIIAKTEYIMWKAECCCWVTKFNSIIHFLDAVIV